MPHQTEAGKAFEFSLLKEFYDRIKTSCEVTIIKDNVYQKAYQSFRLFGSNERTNYIRASRAAVKHLFELEPRLQSPVNPKDILELQIVPDQHGARGDVRDILLIRSKQNWTIGVSAKNNHKAVKHSRLSDKIDFGKEWLEIPCSKEYFDEIVPIFSALRELREKGLLWKEIKNKKTDFYVPVLQSFKNELLRIESKHNGKVPANLLLYLIGNQDFYKVIKSNKRTEIQGFNIHGTLNKNAGKVKPRISISQLKLPSRIVELSMKPKSSDTLFLYCDEGWQLSFRIHNAKSSVEPSLKFDINLVSHPQSLYSHHIKW